MQNVKLLIDDKGKFIRAVLFLRILGRHTTHLDIRACPCEKDNSSKEFLTKKRTPMALKTFGIKQSNIYEDLKEIPGEYFYLFYFSENANKEQIEKIF